MKKIILPLLIVSVFFGCVDKYSDAKEYIQDIDKCKLLIDNGPIRNYINTVPNDTNDLFSIFSDQTRYPGIPVSDTEKYIQDLETECTDTSSVDYYTKCLKPKLFADLSKSSNKIKDQLKEIEEIVFINDDMGLKSAIKEQLTYNLNMLNKDFYDLDEHFRCIWTCNVPEELIESLTYISKFREKYQKENSLFNDRISDCYKRLGDEYKLEISFNKFDMINVFR